MDFDDWEDIEYVAVEEVITDEVEVQVGCTPTPDSSELFGLLVAYHEGHLPWTGEHDGSIAQTEL
jgi:hypothetical protein